MKKHKCARARTCKCYLLALEPADNCPIHGCDYPFRCAECGKFMTHEDIYDPRDLAIMGGDPSL